MNRKVMTISAIVALLAVFMAGFVPQFLANRRLQNELGALRMSLSALELQTTIDGIRNLSGRMLLEASRQNYGTASELSTEYFNRLKDLADRTERGALQSSATDALSLRDPITAGLAQGTPAILPQLESLLQRSYDFPDVTKH